MEMQKQILHSFRTKIKIRQVRGTSFSSSECGANLLSFTKTENKYSNWQFPIIHLRCKALPLSQMLWQDDSTLISSTTSKVRLTLILKCVNGIIHNAVWGKSCSLWQQPQQGCNLQSHRGIILLEGNNIPQKSPNTARLKTKRELYIIYIHLLL